MKLVGEYEYISLVDPALDAEDEEFRAKWGHYLNGKGLPPIREGKTPTVWTVKPITSARLKKRLLAEIRTGSNDSWYLETAARCIKGARDLLDVDGNPVKLRYEMVEGFESLSDETLDAIDALNPAMLVHIGMAMITGGYPS